MSISKDPISTEQADREAKICADLVGRSLGAYLKTVALVSDAYLAQVLIALWDNGVYEYLRGRARLVIAAVAQELDLDPFILTSLVEYLVGRGIMSPDGDGYVLTEKGRPYWNYITRGILTSHLAGYNQMLVHLGPLLRKEINVHDPRLNRCDRLVAAGSGYVLQGSGTIPWILKVIRQLGGQYVLDIGCGAGDFLIQLALRWPEGGGIGIDMSADAIAGARENARRCGVSDRLIFRHAKLSAEPMAIEPEIVGKVDTLTAMYLLHEFAGNGGSGAIVAGISELSQQFPGRKLLMLEGSRIDPVACGANPPRTFAQLDYSFIHPLSRQGPLRTQAEWKQIIGDAGGKLVDCVSGFGQIPAWISLYIVAL